MGVVWVAIVTAASLVGCTHECRVATGDEAGRVDPGTGRCIAESDACAQSDWAACPSACDALDATTCFATPGCRASFFDQGGYRYFVRCSPIAPAASASSCADLDLQGCSERDDCAIIFREHELESGDLFFYKCIAEERDDTCRGDCEPGTHCAHICHADHACIRVCRLDQLRTCPAILPALEQCAVYAHPEFDHPGSCYDECAPPRTCSMATSEAECLAMSACTPDYDGDGCTCNPLGCTCATLTYNHCGGP